MEKRDLLDEIIRGKVSAEQAERICDSALDVSRTGLDVDEKLGLSKKEWVAYAQGVPFDVVARWRGGGWPTQCFVCKGVLASDDFGWMAREYDGSYGLRHIVCAPPSRFD